jgi:membrane-associated phospholipid phosphatase
MSDMKIPLIRQGKSVWAVLILAGVSLFSLPSLADDGWTRAGDALLYALPLTAATATYSLDDPDGRKQLISAYGVTLSISAVLTGLVDRERPDGSDDLSFPSFSAASAFTSAAFMQRRYGWDVGIPAYLAASYASWSRVYSDQNHATDVVAGAALAWGVNRWLVEPGSPSQFALFPTTGGMALAFEVNF